LSSFPRNIALAGLVSIALVLGVVSPANATGQVPPPPVVSKSVPVSSVPPLPVPTAKVSGPSSKATGAAAPAADLVAVPPKPPVVLSAPSSRSAYDPKTSVPISYGANDTIYKNSDGSETKEVSQTPLNVKQPDGSWAPATTTISQNITTGAFAVANNPLSPTFAKTLGAGADFTANSGTDPVSVDLLGAASASAITPSASVLHAEDEGLGTNQSAVSSALEYPGVFSGQDLQYQVTASEVKETLVLNAVPSAALSSWTWLIHAPGLTMSQSDRGSLNFTDTNGVVQYSIPDPIMWDSSGVAGQSEPALVDVPFRFAQTADGDWALTVTPDRSWLTDPARVYPVSVDPTLTVGPTPYTAYESNGTVIANVINVGNSRAGGDTYWRSVVYFQYNNLEGASATNWADEITPNSCIAARYLSGTANLYTGYALHATAWSFGGTDGTELTSWAATSGGTAYCAPGVSGEYQSWINAGTDAGTLMYVGDEQAGLYTYQQIATALYLNNEPAPVVTPVAPSPPNNGRGATMPTLAVSLTDPTTAAQNVTFNVYSSSNTATIPVYSVTTSGTTAASLQVPKGVLTPGAQYWWDGVVADNVGAIRTGALQTFTVNTPAVVTSTGATPGNQSIVTSLTPTLTLPTTGTDANGDPLTYQFRVTTGADGISGQVVSSQVFPAGTSFPLSWTVPAGVLQDGTPYSWSVVVGDGYDNSVGWVNHIQVNQRVTDAGPTPIDSAGPVSVNLGNGNVSASFTSPTVSTVGGAMGLSFNYNSEAASNAGLTGTYYAGTPTGGTSPVLTFPTTNPVVLQRTDPNIAFNWSTLPPVPGLASTNFLAQWSGYLTAPTGATNVTFGFTGNDSATAKINGTTVAALTTPNGSSTPTMNATAASLSAGPNPITVQYSDGTDQAIVGLYVSFTAADGTVVAAEPVPGTWFTKTVQSLPGGWSGSQPLVGDQASYVSAQNNGSSIVFTDVAGATHTYTLTAGSTGYSPPAGESGTVTVTAGIINLSDSDGSVYVFDNTGKLTSVTAATDPASKPAEPIPAYNSNNQITSLTDALSVGGTVRKVGFVYATSTNTGSGQQCATPAAFTAAPVGMLCQITYPDSSVTNLYFDSHGQLAEVADPGGMITNFGYTPVGNAYLLSSVRNATANQWLAYHSITPSTPDTTATNITYNTVATSPTFGWATGVNLPAPDGVTAANEPSKSYTYGTLSTPTSNGLTYVDEAGVTGTEADGHTRTVTFNPSLQEVSDESAGGLITRNTWDPGNTDNLWATFNPDGTETSTFYDWEGRPTDSYGPAPSSCFTTPTTTPPVPNGSCALPPAHTKTVYDGGSTQTTFDGKTADTVAGNLNGLNAEFFAGSTLTGAPKAFALGVGTTDGSVNKTWTTAPPGLTGTTNFSAELTGTINFPSSATYTLSVLSGGAAQLYINDVLVVNQTVAGSTLSLPFGATAGPARIKLIYGQGTGTAQLVLSWAGPGVTSGPIQGSYLSPNYGLVTSTQTDDSVPSGVSGITAGQVTAGTTATSYGSSPWLGQVTTSTVDPLSVDPTGLDLTSTASYENSTSLYDRQTGSTKPAGAATASSVAYYLPTGTAGTNIGPAPGGATNCVTPGTPQYGMVNTVTGPTNSDGVYKTTSYVYDLMGRVLGSESTGDASWTCTTYDAAGRVSTISYPQYGTGTGQGARKVTYKYTDTGAYNSSGVQTGDPLTTSVGDDAVITGSPNGDVVTTVSNLLGQTFSSTDVWGTVTKPTYNLLGQVISETVTPPTSVTTAGATKSLAFTYKVDGQLATETVNGTLLATANYDSAGRLANTTGPTTPAVAYGNGTSLSTVTYGSTGALTGEGWSFATGQAGVSDADILSQSGRILQDTITDGSTPYTSTYTYDADGRLTNAAVPDNQLSYSFAPASYCGVQSSTNDAAAGNDGNRTSSSDTTTNPVTHVAATPVTVTSCYDNADRLTSDSVSGAPSGSSPILSTPLVSTAGPGQNLTYDSHGDITAIADQAMTYDQTGRHLSTTTSNTGTSGPTDTVAYVRDVTGAAIQMATIVGGTTTTVDYSGGGGIGYTFNGGSTFNTTLNETTLSLPGGVTLSLQGSSVQVWSYPDLHGDDTVTTDGTGTRIATATGAIAVYDPFGNPINLLTGQIGTITADTTSIPTNTTTPGASYGWEGSHGKQDQTTGDIATIEMGARQYVPLLGRFLSVDPVAGGNSNDYNYPNDPVNDSDVGGDKSKKNNTNVFDLFFEWVTGKGPRHQVFKASDPFTKEFKTNSNVASAKKSMIARLSAGTSSGHDYPYSLGSWNGVGLYLDDYSSVYDFGATGNLAVTYIGSYNMSVTPSNVTSDSATLNFHVTNTSDLASALHPIFYGEIPGYSAVETWENSLPSPGGPFSATTQDISWSENVTW
jgi:RHS repeat-associated protein